MLKSGSFVDLIINVCVVTHAHTYLHSPSSPFSYFLMLFWPHDRYISQVYPSFVPSSTVILLSFLLALLPLLHQPSHLFLRISVFIISFLYNIYRLVIFLFVYFIFQISHFVLKILRFLFLMLHWEDDVSVIEVRNSSYTYIII